VQCNNPADNLYAITSTRAYWYYPRSKIHFEKLEKMAQVYPLLEEPPHIRMGSMPLSKVVLCPPQTHKINPTRTIQPLSKRTQPSSTFTMPSNNNAGNAANNGGAKSTPMTGSDASRIQSTQVSLPGGNLDGDSLLTFAPANRWQGYVVRGLRRARPGRCREEREPEEVDWLRRMAA
jgi:hypothetical protein